MNLNSTTVCRAAFIALSLSCLLNASAALAEATDATRANAMSGAGTWRSSRVAASGTWQADLTKRGDDVEGAFSLAGSPLTSGTVVGMAIEGERITFGILDRQHSNGLKQEPAASFTGTLNGSTVSGTYTTQFGDEGEWEGTLTASE